MNRSFQLILLAASLVVCLSLIIPAGIYETADLTSTADKPSVVKGPTDTAAENPADKPAVDRDLQSIPDDLNQAYDLPNNMYIVRRGSTDRLTSRETTDAVVNANGAEDKTASDTPDKATENAGTPTAKPESKTTNLSTAKTSETKPKAEDELDLLARLITAEAQGEPYDAKVAVGAVVMNRVKSSEFPNTIKEVIYQNIDGYYQFTPVVNGWIGKPAHSDCIEAAKEALNGTDPTNGALFFYSNRSTNTWLLEKPISITSGNLIFAY